MLLSDPEVAAYYEKIGLTDELRKKTRYVKEPITALSGKVWYLMLPFIEANHIKKNTLAPKLN